MNVENGINNKEKNIRKQLIDFYGVYTKTFVLGSETYFILYYYRVKSNKDDVATRELYSDRIFKSMEEAREYCQANFNRWQYGVK